MSKVLDVIFLPFALVMLSLEMILTLAAMSLVAMRLTVNGVPWKFGFTVMLQIVDLAHDHIRKNYKEMSRETR